MKDQHVYEETAPFLAYVQPLLHIFVLLDLSTRINQLFFGTSLLSTLGEHHRKQRKMLNPVFSPKHMRDLVSVFYPIANQVSAGL